MTICIHRVGAHMTETVGPGDKRGGIPYIDIEVTSCRLAWIINSKAYWWDSRVGETLIAFISSVDWPLQGQTLWYQLWRINH